MAQEVKIAVMADIHSNFEAFRTCAEEAERREIRDYIFLGDYLGDLAYPRKTLGLMKEWKEKYNCVFIRGNKEDYWINHRKNKGEIWESGTSGSGMLFYNYENLTDEDIDSFERMDITKQIRIEGFPEFTVCHGSPFRVNQSMRPDFDYIDELTARLPAQLTLCGHFHSKVDYTRNGNRVINPGSVGLALRSGGRRTQFMILNGKDGVWEPEFLSLAYDAEGAIREMDEEELYRKAPCWYRMTKHILRTGNDSFPAMIRKARELYMSHTGIDTWKNIPEKYWEMALEAFGI